MARQRRQIRRAYLVAKSAETSALTAHRIDSKTLPDLSYPRCVVYADSALKALQIALRRAAA